MAVRTDWSDLVSWDVQNGGFPVVLNVYDLSMGMASMFSQQFLGKYIEAIWHTGIVVYGREFFFGGGICVGSPGRTPYGSPKQVYIVRFMLSQSIRD